MRWLVVAVLLSALGLGVFVARAPELRAQVPARLFGTVTVDGATPPLGKRVEAFIDGRPCGEGVVRQLGAEIGIGYVLDVRPETIEPGCGANGRMITLRVGGLEAQQGAEFLSGAFISVYLTVTIAV